MAAEPAEPREVSDELIAAVKAHAQTNYDAGGWDVVIECYSDRELRDFLREEGAYTIEDALKAFAPLIDVWSDRQADARNSAF